MTDRIAVRATAKVGGLRPGAVVEIDPTDPRWARRLASRLVVAEDPPASEDLRALTVPVLQDRLRAAGLPVSGSKDDLVERLAAATEPPAGGEDADTPDEGDADEGDSPTDGD